MSENPARHRRLWLIPVVLAALLAGAGLGFALRGGGANAAPAPAAHAEGDVLFWTCSMHPQVHESHPGKCPICGMDLIPVHKTGTEAPAGAPRLVLSEEAKRLAEIQTSPVERKAAEAELRLLGSVAYDEQLVRQVAARFAGRIDRLHVNFTGAAVKPGEPLAELYSPEVLAAGEELLQARRAAGAPGAESGEYLRGLSAKTLEAVRAKLRLLGLSAEQVAEIEQSGKVADHVTVQSPMAGTVVRKLVSEGDYVATGAPLYTLADLSRVWLLLDAYEADLPLVQVGQEAAVTAEAFPGQTFKAKVLFIDPTLNPETRTARLRLEVENPEGRLKPGAFGYGLLRRRLGEDGRLPLVIPASAPLLTGTRAVVYVQVADAERPTYDGRVVELGPRAGDYWVVLSGLSEGEQVVTRGNFKIDAALQIQARPSLMSPAGGGGAPPPGHQHGTAQGGAPAAAGAGQQAAARLKPQETCPVMGGKIDRRVFADYGGKRIYFCCAGCPEAFLKEPDKYLRKLRELGQEPEDAPAAPPPAGHRH